MPNIYRVEPIETAFSITWNIGRRCNYDCMYCPTDLHDNHSTHASLKVLQTRWESIVDKTSNKNLPYKISFAGGEVSTNKNFMPLVEWMKANYQSKISKILVTSNGSASLRYYTKMLSLIDNLNLSFHSEHADEQKFFNLVLSLNQNLPPGKHLHVIIMDEFWNADRIPVYEKILTNNKVSHSINKIHYAKQTRTFPIMKGKANLDLQ